MLERNRERKNEHPGIQTDLEKRLQGNTVSLFIYTLYNYKPFLFEGQDQ